MTTVHLETARIQAVLVNAGLCSYEKAYEVLSAAQLIIHIEEQAETIAGQAAFLTAVVTASRCFLGGVFITGNIDVPLLLSNIFEAKTLNDAARLLGARSSMVPANARMILIGKSDCVVDRWSVRAFWNGWVAGVMPGKNNCAAASSNCALAGIAAGALAVGQAFDAQQNNVLAGKFTQIVSLWSPDLGEDGADYHAPDMGQISLPNSLWLIGLGNLGQAYIWSLSMLPYKSATDLTLFLQDDDTVRAENWGTSILIQEKKYGDLKTYVVEKWCQTRGFNVRRIDRRLDGNLRCTGKEPLIALAGLDRIPPRRLLGLPGFEYVIDAGLGATTRDYKDFRINVFDKLLDPAHHFADMDDNQKATIDQLMQLPAYRELAEAEGAKAACGLAVDLAGSSVAVPFVSTFVGALAVAQAIRIASNCPHHQTIQGNVNDMRTIRATLGLQPDRISVGAVKISA